MLYFRTIFSTLMLIFAALGGVRAETATVAVATNFLTTAELLVEAFEKESGHQIVLVPGSTGKLYAQILNGAPFDIFLAADADRPEALEREGLANARDLYAFGRLVLLVRGAREASLETIASDRLRLAIANPELAPYGAAAQQVLGAVRGFDDWDANLVYGEDIGQTMSFVATRNADAGLLALSQMPLVRFRSQQFLIPEDLYRPIRQEAVLLDRGASNEAARIFYDYIRSPPGIRLIDAAGYGVPE